VTLYDGPSQEFARKLLRVLKDFTWRFRVSLPEHTTLTKIHIKTKGKRAPKPDKEFSPRLKELFWNVTSEELTSHPKTS
jgi:hypothetical protein